jgi:hypothetical protein
MSSQTPIDTKITTDSGNLVYIICGVLILCGLIVGGYFLYKQLNSGSSTSSSQNNQNNQNNNETQNNNNNQPNNPNNDPNNVNGNTVQNCGSNTTNGPFSSGEVFGIEFRFFDYYDQNFSIDPVTTLLMFGGAPITGDRLQLPKGYRIATLVDMQNAAYQGMQHYAWGLCQGSTDRNLRSVYPCQCQFVTQGQSAGDPTQPYGPRLHSIQLTIEGQSISGQTSPSVLWIYGPKPQANTYNNCIPENGNATSACTAGFSFGSDDPLKTPGRQIFDWYIPLQNEPPSLRAWNQADKAPIASSGAMFPLITLINNQQYALTIGKTGLELSQTNYAPCLYLVDPKRPNDGTGTPPPGTQSFSSKPHVYLVLQIENIQSSVSPQGAFTCVTVPNDTPNIAIQPNATSFPDIELQLTPSFSFGTASVSSIPLLPLTPAEIDWYLSPQPDGTLRALGNYQYGLGCVDITKSPSVVLTVDPTTWLKFSKGEWKNIVVQF